MPRRSTARSWPLVLFALTPLTAGCSAIASQAVGGTVKGLAVSVAQDDDPELVAGAMPLGLKLLEASLVRDPANAELLLSACRGYTQYAQAFVAQPAYVLEESDLQGARRARQRAGRMFLRAREYCLRALERRHPGISATLAARPMAALERARRRDAELLFWTGASWAAAISSLRQDLELVADLRVGHALLRRASELDGTWDRGTIHETLVAVEAALAPASGGSVERAREHFRIARELSGGRRIGPLVTLAEAVCVKEQDLAGFRRVLAEALAFDVATAPEDRLVNTLARRRAEWLLARTDDLFVEANP
jgi:predicted anti-sigma-YlaC factor YlaD